VGTKTRFLSQMSNVSASDDGGHVARRSQKVLLYRRLGLI